MAARTQSSSSGRVNPERGSEADWFAPARQFSAPSDGQAVRTQSSNPLQRTSSSPGKRTGKSPKTPDQPKRGFADLTETGTGYKEKRLTVKDLESEMRSLNKQNDDLSDEVFKMHIALLKLVSSAVCLLCLIRYPALTWLDQGDPTEEAFARTSLIKDTWVVEGHEGVGEPGIEFACKPQHAAHVLNCKGHTEHTPITISGSLKRLDIENCKRVRICVEAVLFGISVRNCQDVLIVAGGEVPDVEVESSTAIAFLICHKMIDGKFRCTNSGGIIVSTVDRGDNPVMLPEHILAANNLVSAEIPAYFVTTSSYRTWTSQVTAHSQME